MSRSHSIAKYTRSLETAICDGAWTRVESAVERLRELLVEAIVRQAGAEIEQIKIALSTNRARLMALHQVQPDRDARALAWMMAGDTGTSVLAAELVPSAAEVPTEAFRHAREKVLNHLSNCPPQTTAEIAGNLAYTRETVSRALTELRAEGLVATVPVGRQRMHRITARGRTSLHGIQQDSPARLNRTVTDILGHSTPKHVSERLVRTEGLGQNESANRPGRDSFRIHLFDECISSFARSGKADEFFSDFGADVAPRRIPDEYQNIERRPDRALTGD